MVEQLDPDANLRDGEGGTAPGRFDGEDIVSLQLYNASDYELTRAVQAYERALVRTLYEYVRAGKLEKAVDMCRQSDQSWRAASLSGGMLWSDPELAAGQDDFGDDMDTEMGEVQQKQAKGNLNRRMWKLTCRKLAAAVSVHRTPFESFPDIRSRSPDSTPMNARCMVPSPGTRLPSFQSARRGKITSGPTSTHCSKPRWRQDCGRLQQADSGTEVRTGR